MGLTAGMALKRRPAVEGQRPSRKCSWPKEKLRQRAAGGPELALFKEPEWAMPSAR